MELAIIRTKTGPSTFHNIKRNAHTEKKRKKKKREKNKRSKTKTKYNIKYDIAQHKFAKLTPIWDHKCNCRPLW